MNSRIDHIYKDFHTKSNFRLHYGDLADSNSIVNVISKVRPNEIYNLSAQSHVGHSFEIPEYTADVDGTGVMRLLEIVRSLPQQIQQKIRRMGDRRSIEL